MSFSPSAPLLLVLVLALALRDAPAGGAGARAAAVATYFAVGGAALVAHEWAHAAAATMAGGRPSGLEVHGLGAAVHVDGVPPHQLGAVAAAGPVMTLTVAALAWAGGWASSFLGAPELGYLARGAAAAAFAMGALNLLPMGGMDGDVLARLGRSARVARSCSWTMVGLLITSGFVARLALDASPTGAWFGGAVALGGIAGALVVGWHGVLNAVSGERDEWGDVVEKRDAGRPSAKG